MVAAILAVAVLAVAVLGIAVLGVTPGIHAVGAIDACAVRVAILAVTVRRTAIRIAVEVVAVTGICIIVISTHSVLFI